MVVSSKGIVMSSKSMAEVAKKLNLEEAVVLVVAVLVMGLVLDMEKDLSMMEEEKGRLYLQSEH